MKNFSYKVIINSVIALILLLTMTNCKGGKVKQGTRNAYTVAVMKIEQNTVKRSVEVFGTVYGEFQVMVTPKIIGRVTEIVKPEGSSVLENDTILFVLNDIPGMDYKPGPVLSPIAGTVGKIYVDVGQMVTQATVVAAIAKYSENVKVKAPIADVDLPYVRKGALALVSISAISNGTFEGRVTNVSNVVDPMSGAAMVEITIPNRDKKIIPGMTCSVNLLLEEKNNVIAVPYAALFTDGFSQVMVVDADNVAHRREIKVGLVGDELIEVKSGLQLGERVITIGKERVSDGDKVTAVEVQ